MLIYFCRFVPSIRVPNFSLFYCFINSAEGQFNPINEFYTDFVLEKRMTPFKDFRTCSVFTNLLNWFVVYSLRLNTVCVTTNDNLAAPYNTLLGF
jgi:hypothetical protein